MTNITLYFTTILLLFSNCSNEQIVERWEDGNIKKTIIEDKAKNFETNFHKNGTIQSEGLTIQSQKEKDWIFYHPNGEVQERSFYREGKPFGKFKTFYQNGIKEKQGNYDDLGLKTGEWMSYWENGRLKNINVYEDGKKTSSINYNVDGALEEEFVKNDNGDFEYEYVFADGGKLERNVEYYPRGTIMEERYAVGSANQKFFVTAYHENGLKANEGIKTFSKETGSWTYWFSNGQKKAEGNFLVHEQLIPSSNVKKTKIESKLPHKIYYSGIQIGNWTYWNRKGEKILEVNSKMQDDKIVEKVIYTRLK